LFAFFIYICIKVKTMYKLLTSLLFLMIMQMQAQQINMKALSKTEKKIVERIEKNYNETLKLLEETVNINSGTFNVEGVREVCKVYQREFSKIGFEVQCVEVPESHKRGPHFVATRKGKKGKKLFFIGHLDTVYERDMPFQPFTIIDEKTASGQGTNDMKGGNAMIFASLKALHELGLLKDRHITVYFAGDEEESFKPTSIGRKHFRETAQGHDYAIGYETGAGVDLAVVGRRGVSDWEIKITGKQGHSSGIFTPDLGYGSILEAARILNEFRETFDKVPNVTFNPGVIVGGSEVNFDSKKIAGSASGKTNIVTKTTIVKGDFRFVGQEQRDWIKQKMQEIAGKNLNQTSAEIKFVDGIPSMGDSKGNYALLEILNQTSQSIGLGEVKPQDLMSRGAADVSYVADLLDCIDGLGATGEGTHTPQENMNLEHFPVLIKRSAIFIHRLTK
jgi:glutamate carboxypeptidase